MVIQNPNACLTNLELNIKLDNEDIKQVDHFKYLGVLIDRNLTFAQHVECIKGKINQRTGLLWCIRNIVDKNLARDLSQSLIEPHFLYCSQIYDACGVELCKQLQICQNKALGAVLGVNNRYPTEKLHGKTCVKWLGISRAKNTCTKIWKLLNGSGPKTLCDDIKLYEAVRDLRCANKYQLVRSKTYMY